MKNFKQRVSRLERQTGVSDPRWVLVITCTDPDAARPPERFGVEVAPNHFALVWGGPLTTAELAELKSKYAAEEANRPEET